MIVSVEPEQHRLGLSIKAMDETPDEKKAEEKTEEKVEEKPAEEVKA